MRLTHVSIENFRGIGRLELDLDRLTVVIGENNHGKSSLLDVLERCLGRPGAAAPSHFDAADFRRVGGNPPLPIRVVLTFERPSRHEGGGGEAGPLDLAATVDRDGRRRLRVRFTGSPDDGVMNAVLVEEDGQVADRPHDLVVSRLRRTHPVLLVRLAQPHTAAGFDWRRSDEQDDREDSEHGYEEDIARIYRRLVETRGPVPAQDVQRAVQAAYRLRDTLAERYLDQGGPLRAILEHMVAEGNGGTGDLRYRPGSGSHVLGILLVLGSLIDGRGDAALPSDAEPILAIEEPEVHLHPMVVASTWDVIEDLRTQTLVITNSGEFLSKVPLRFLRRLLRRDGTIGAHRLHEGTLSQEGLRRVGYHIRAKRGSALFARCWLLVEGETEFWLVRALAQVLGYDLEAEGVQVVEFAQCGVEPLVRLADALRIEWHLLADGDGSGTAYVREAREHLHGRPVKRHATRLRRRTVEMELWHGGFQDVYRRTAGIPVEGPLKVDGKTLNAYHVVNRAIRRRSKPYLAQTVGEECQRRGPDSVPRALRQVIETSVELARAAIDDGAGAGAVSSPEGPRGRDHDAR